MHRLFPVLFLFVVLAECLHAQVATDTLPRRPRIGVALSGGGARGTAHIGVLRAIEEAGIPIDYVAGTSMGSIVGGLYCLGYSVDELDSLVRSADWDLLLSDKSPQRELSLFQRERSGRFLLNVPLGKTARPEMTGLVKGRNLGNLLARLTVGYHDSISFDSLRIPFACVATNLANGAEVDFRSGILTTAIRASMAIPGVFTSVKWNGTELVDGGLANNFPVDLVRSMGADIVIGVTVQRELADTMGRSGIYDVVNQIISIASRDKYDENVRSCDVLLRVNSKGVSTMGFTPAAIDTMIRRGYETARAHWDELQEVALKANAPKPSSSPFMAERGPVLSVYPVRLVKFEGITAAEERIVRRACKLVDGTSISQEQIEQAIRLLGERFLYLDANFALTATQDDYDLTFYAEQRTMSKVGVGARFDTEQLAAVLLDANFVFHSRVPSSIDITAWLKEQYAARVSYTVEPWLNRQLNFYYHFRLKDFDVNYRGDKAYNIEFQLHQAGLFFAHRNLRNFDAEAGLYVSHFKLKNLFVRDSAAGMGFAFSTDTYYSAFLRLNYNSQDREDFPARGSKLQAEYTYTTSSLDHLKKPYAFSTVLASWETVLRLAPRWAVLPRVGGRIVLGDDVPYIFRNAVGGYEWGKYLDQQLPFAGISHMEHLRNALVTADFRLRYNFLDRQYIVLHGASLAEHRNLKNFGKANYEFGTALQYSYDSKFGPLSAYLGYSSQCKKPYLYINIGHSF